MITTLAAALCLQALSTQPVPKTAEVRQIAGWSVEISPQLAKDSPNELAVALPLLEEQLKEVKRLLPQPAVKKLQQVKLFLSPLYKGVTPKAEYHPGSQWLKDNNRDPRMAKGIEFTNISIFDQEVKRMPVFVLHELSHAWHDQELVGGFDNPSIKLAYQAAKASQSYENVERQDAAGRRTKDKAYAMTNPAEYFAELTEAFFSTNDFYPFSWAELVWHDPAGAKAVREAWGVPEISQPPASLTKNPFYAKFLDAKGFPVVSSAKVSDYALKEAGYLISQVLDHRPDIKKAMVTGGSRMVVMAWNEMTTQVPEHSMLDPKDFWDRRARGLGGSETDPVCSCGEENLLNFPGDPYSTENITIHEFAHSVHLRGLNVVDPTFDARLKEVYEESLKKGLWKGTYAATNHAEFFAEAVQSWLDTNRENDAYHNSVNTRAELKAYDPALAKLMLEVLGDLPWRYTKAVTRLKDHLAGYDPSKAPTFVWPKGS